MKKFIFSLATLTIATVVTLVTVSYSDTASLFEMNVEALANFESPSQYDPVWFVNYMDITAIICTPGGSCVCL